jgi:hypothetical protein
MDPNANIAEQRRITAQILDVNDPGRLDELAVRLAELSQALDEWRRKGGFDPYLGAPEYVGNNMAAQRELASSIVGAWRAPGGAYEPADGAKLAEMVLAHAAPAKPDAMRALALEITAMYEGDGESGNIAAKAYALADMVICQPPTLALTNDQRAKLRQAASERGEEVTPEYLHEQAERALAIGVNTIYEPDYDERV